MVEINEGIGLPDSFSKFIALHHLSRLFEQNLQDLQGLLLQSNPGSVTAKFSRFLIQLEGPKLNNSARCV
jgi:hypothetical protein